MCFGCSSWLSGALGGCIECLQHHLTYGHLIGTLNNKRLVVSTFPFFCSFYAFQHSLFFNHQFLLGDLFIILSFVNTCSSDSLIGPLFALIHFLVCCFSSIFPSYLFSFLTNDTHIFAHAHVIPFAFNHFVFLLAFVGVGCSTSKVIILGPSSLPPKFALVTSFYCPINEIRILNIPFGFGYFSSPFL